MTPVIIFVIRLLIVLKHATCFLPPCQTARVTLLALPPLISRMSILTWRTFLTRVPRGPVTVMRRDLMEAVIPSGMSSSSVWRTSRIYSDQCKSALGSDGCISCLDHPSSRILLRFGTRKWFRVSRSMNTTFWVVIWRMGWFLPWY